MTILSIEEQEAAIAQGTELLTKLKAHAEATGDEELLGLYRRLHAPARSVKEHLGGVAGRGDVTTFGGTPTPDDPVVQQ